MKQNALRHFCIIGLVLSLYNSLAMAQVTVTPTAGAAGSWQTITFRVSSVCPDTNPLGGFFIALPQHTGFLFKQAIARDGWSYFVNSPVEKNGPLGRPGSVDWNYSHLKQPEGDIAAEEFSLEGRLPKKAGMLSFSVQPTCTGASSNTPSQLVHVYVQAPAIAPMVESAGRINPAAKGEDTRAVLVLHPSRHLRLISASSPVAGTIEIQPTITSKIKSVFMRTSKAYIDLPGGRTTNDVQLVLRGLSKTVDNGREWPLTLLFEDDTGTISEWTLYLTLYSGD